MVKAFIKAISGLFQHVADICIEYVLRVFQSYGVYGQVILDLPYVNSGIIFSQVVALEVLALKVAYEGYMTYILREQGDPSASPRHLLVGTIRATGIIAVMPWLVKYLYKFGTVLAADVSGIPNAPAASNPNTSTFNELSNMLSDAGGLVLLIAVGIIFGIIMLIIIFIQSFIRAAELVVNAWTGCFMALGLTNAESKSWQTWWQDTLYLCLTQALVLALIRLCFYSLTPIRAELNGQTITLTSDINLVFFLACIWITYKAPSILKDKMHSTGLARAGASIGQTLITRLAFRR